MGRVLPEVRAAGADLTVVGSGRPDHARDFLATTHLDATVFCDPSLNTYRLAGLKRGIWRTYSPRSALHAIRTLFNGFFPHKPAGDGFQQGGVLVIVPGGKILYHHAANTAGEPLPLDAILAAVRRTAAPAA